MFFIPFHKNKDLEKLEEMVKKSFERYLKTISGKKLPITITENRQKDMFREIVAIAPLDAESAILNPNMGRKTNALVEREVFDRILRYFHNVSFPEIERIARERDTSMTFDLACVSCFEFILKNFGEDEWQKMHKEILKNSTIKYFIWMKARIFPDNSKIETDFGYTMDSDYFVPEDGNDMLPFGIWLPEFLIKKTGQAR